MLRLECIPNAKQTEEYEYLTALSNSNVYVCMTMTCDTLITSIGYSMICSDIWHKYHDYIRHKPTD